MKLNIVTAYVCLKKYVTLQNNTFKNTKNQTLLIVTIMVDVYKEINLYN